MADNIPEGISFAELQQFLEDAPTEKTVDTSTEVPDYSFEDICEMAAETKSAFFRKVKSPLAMKMMVLMILSDMEDWHARMGEETFAEADNMLSLQCWTRDAGKICAMKETLMDIEVEPHDPTPRWKE